MVEITDLLLRAGSDVDATANVYGGACTALLLTATSVHPERAGVQEALLRMLLEQGARIDDGIILCCLANGRLKAAEFLAARGANVGPVEAAALGRLNEVKAHFAHKNPSDAVEQKQAFLYACEFGRDDVVEFLVGKGIDLGVQDAQGQTGLHMAVIGGHPSTVNLLLKHHPSLETRNSYGGTAVGQALWSAAHDGDPDVYVSILHALVKAGAKLPERHAPINAKIDEWLEQHGSRVHIEDR
jgi:ankyrin repeat protein